MGLLQNILHELTVGGTAHPAPQPTHNVNVMQANGHYSPAPLPQYIQNMPQVQSPQNLQQYGNAQGQHWMENGQGQKFAMPQLQQSHAPADQRLLPPVNPYNRPAIAQPQWQQAQQPQLRTQII